MRAVGEDYVDAAWKRANLKLKQAEKFAGTRRAGRGKKKQ